MPSHLAAAANVKPDVRSGSRAAEGRSIDASKKMGQQ